MYHLPKSLEMDNVVILEFQIMETIGNLNDHSDQVAIFQKQSQRRCPAKPLGEVQSYPEKSVVSRDGNSGSNATVENAL